MNIYNINLFLQLRELCMDNNIGYIYILVRRSDILCKRDNTFISMQRLQKLQYMNILRYYDDIRDAFSDLIFLENPDQWTILLAEGSCYSSNQGTPNLHKELYRIIAGTPTISNLYGHDDLFIKEVVRLKEKKDKEIEKRKREAVLWEERMRYD